MIASLKVRRRIAGLKNEIKPAIIRREHAAISRAKPKCARGGVLSYAQKIGIKGAGLEGHVLGKHAPMHVIVVESVAERQRRIWRIICGARLNHPTRPIVAEQIRRQRVGAL